MDNHIELVYKPRQCVFTFCDEPQGIGTWIQIGEYEPSVVLPVCEEHWQAIRKVP